MSESEYSSSNYFNELRKKAEEHLSNSLKTDSQYYKQLDVEEVRQLIHELGVHQTELEMQNEELQKTQVALQTSQELYAELYESAPISYFTLSRDGSILDLNQTAVDKLKISKTELIQQPFHSLVAWEDRDQLQLFLNGLLTSDTVQQCELKIDLSYTSKNTDDQHLTASGRCWALLEGRSFQKDDNGIQFRLTLSDITDRKQLESELRDAKQLAEKNNSLKTNFLANMSHEIRTPMNGIIGFTKLLQESNLTSEEQHQYLELLYKSGRRLLNTVNDIIEVSKAEAGMTSAELTPLNINEKLSDLVDFFQQEASQKALTLTLDSKLNEQSAFVWGDESKIESIITNLIKNAIKYTNEGSIRVTTYIEESFLIFEVADTGIGIAEDQQEAIFNKYERADTIDQRVIEGTGLGLSLIKSYVHLLDGQFWLKSTPGKGSTFYIGLPFKPADQYAVSKAKHQKTSKEYIEKKLKSYKVSPKVIIAEDDKASYLVLSQMLKPFTNNLIHVVDGYDTIEACRLNPDTAIIFMDINMPGQDGYEATKAIRRFNQNVFIIAQTAYSLKGDQEKALQAGMDTYIPKPVNEQDLLEALDQSFQP